MKTYKIAVALLCGAGFASLCLLLLNLSSISFSTFIDRVSAHEPATTFSFSLRRFAMKQAMALKCIAMTVLVCCLFVPVRAAVSAPLDRTCDLPADLQHEITINYPGAKIVASSD